MLCQTSNEAGEGFPSTLTRPSPPPFSSAPRVVPPTAFAPADSVTQKKQMNGTKERKVAVASPQPLIGMRLSVSVRFAGRWNPRQTHSHPLAAAAVVLFLFFFLFLLPVNMQRNWLLTFNGIVWGNIIIPNDIWLLNLW